MTNIDHRALLFAVCAVGCARTTADRAAMQEADERAGAAAIERAEPERRDERAAAQGERAEPPELTITTVYLDPTLAEACGLVLPPKTFFEFDSAKLDPADHRLLGDVATCLTSGPLAGRKVELVGHTDPRGSDEYNRQLGRSRAQSVQDFLQQRGVGQDRLVVRSAGEQRAEEAQPSGWPLDRRVDIRLLPTP